MNGQPATVLSKSARRYSLAVLVVVYTFNFIDRQILAILLPAIKAEFLVDDWVLGFLVGTSFALFYATLGMPIALLADRWNRRNLFNATAFLNNLVDSCANVMTAPVSSETHLAIDRQV